MANATAEFAIDGPQVLSLTTGPSDADGYAEATWKTSTPNKRGVGGTPPGSYTATLANLALAGYTWDGQGLSTGFTLQ